MAEASQEDRDKIVDLIKKGKIKLSASAQRYFDRAGGIRADGKADFTIVEAEVDSFWGPYESNNGGLDIHWSTVSAGFGRLTVHITKDGKLKAETEGMGKEFCKAVLAKLVDNWDDSDE